MKIPETLQFDAVISRVGAVEGDAQAVNARHSLMTLINTANEDMKFLINNLMSSVGEQVSEECSLHLQLVCIPCVQMAKDINEHIKILIETDPKVDLVQVQQSAIWTVHYISGYAHCVS